MTVPRMRVAIIGAGIGGLTLGLLLRQRGVDAQIYDQADELREVGAAVALAANGTRVLRRVGLGEQLAEFSVEPTEVIYRHWQSGRRIVAFPMREQYNKRYGAEFFAIHRVHLQHILATAWGAAGLKLNSRLVRLEQRPDDVVRMHFAGGQSAEADLVIGADGVHSVVRNWLSGGAHAVAYSGTSGFRGIVAIDALPSLPDPMSFQLWFGPGAHFLSYPITGGLLNFLAVVPGPDPWQHPSWRVDEPAETAAGIFQDWHRPVVDMIEAVEQSPRWGLFSLPPLQRWHRGNVVLLGDAAHAMLPHEGQGANQAIEDAAVLAEFVAGAKRAELSDALRRYEILRRPRTRFIQRSSWINSDVFHLADGPEVVRRDARLSDLSAHLDWIHGYDIGRVLTPEADLPYASPLHRGAGFSRRDAVPS